MSNHIDQELENAIATEIMHLSRKILQRSMRAMTDLNIGVGQFPILKLLGDNGTMTQRQIADEIRVTPATISGTIKRMERAGLVQRAADKEDARVTRISLTEEGHARYALARVIDIPYKEMLAGFTEEESRQVLHFASRMSRNLSKNDEEERPNEDR